MLVHEIFKSISGETSNAGVPMTFVRLYGCNVKCSYCDQPQTPEDKHKMNINSIITEVRRLGVKNVCITGGEPLIQEETLPLVYELEGLGYDVQIETNGTIPLEEYRRRHYRYIMDVKCPSSKVSQSNDYSNLAKLGVQDEVKFVIQNKFDYDFALRIIKKYPTSALILFSPAFDKNNRCIIGNELVQWLLRDNPNFGNYRVQIQLHKIINVQ